MTDTAGRVPLDDDVEATAEWDGDVLVIATSLDSVRLTVPQQERLAGLLAARVTSGAVRDPEGPEQFVLAEPWATKELWTYVIGPFDTGDAAKAHAKKYRISAHSVRSLVRP